MTSTQAKEDLVTVTIDGIEISVPHGTLLIRAAEQRDRVVVDLRGAATITVAVPG